MSYSQQMGERLRLLEEHLQQENSLLLEVVKSYRKLDQVGHAIGLVDQGGSYATHVTWWPLISILGTFSAGKSSFINHYLGTPLQQTGNQAVDDKFTVITYTREEQSRTIPGRALDSDPRFPLFRISHDIEAAADGEGERIDAYLQLKTIHSRAVRGKIIIDSPGFDADQQRTATLRITDRMIDLSDLVLVFFDARHPEPGAMRDTLQHLVADAMSRHDSNKFIYILNQIDVTAREDNPEEVVAAWQRALSQQGLTAGRFYRIYNPDAAVPIEEEAVRERFERKRQQDMSEIETRIDQLEVERAYRIVGHLSHTARVLQEQWVPKLRGLGLRWRRRVLLTELALLVTMLALLLGVSIQQQWWDGFTLQLPFEWTRTMGIMAAVVALLIHFGVRRLSAKRLLTLMQREAEGENQHDLAGLMAAFRKGTRPWISLFHPFPVGWNFWTREKLRQIRAEADRAILQLNDRFTDPSGEAQNEEGRASVSTVGAEEPEPGGDELPVDHTERGEGEVN